MAMKISLSQPGEHFETNPNQVGENVTGRQDSSVDRASESEGPRFQPRRMAVYFSLWDNVNKTAFNVLKNGITMRVQADRNVRKS